MGAGLAGCEAAYRLAQNSIEVELYDIKPNGFTPAHSYKGFAELVCSNSLKGNDCFSNACGLLKQEMRNLGSLIIDCADKTAVAAGGALAVDRYAFSDAVTQKILSHPNIKFIGGEVTDLPERDAIICTGPLTCDALAHQVSRLCGGNLYFYDAAAPIVSADSIDFESAFISDRYGDGEGDYVNCPLTEDEYNAFLDALNGAERAKAHDFDKREIFEGCMPVEVMAERGRDTLRFGMMKPVGLRDKNGVRPYAVVQLRKENSQGTAYNLVGFQTNLKFAEQKRVFSMIPALKGAEFLRYGVMHRNTFLASPKLLDDTFMLKNSDGVYFGGQITGVEGYVESAASGLYAAISYLLRKRNVCDKLSVNTVTGALANHVSAPNEHFQPMNANFGVLPPLSVNVRDKALKKKTMAQRALDEINEFKRRLESYGIK